MRKIFALVSVIVMAIAAGNVIAQDSHYIEGKNFVRIDPVVPPLENAEAKHEVVELFWYGCSHCYDFEPHINKWKENKSSDVSFIRVPAIFNPRWEQHARAYYSLELMGELQKGHDLLFNGIHEQGRGLHDLDSMARFFAANDIDEAKFRESFNSFAVETKINRAKQLVRQYQITGVPTVIIDGEFKVSASTAGGYPQLVDIIDNLTAATGE